MNWIDIDDQKKPANYRMVLIAYQNPRGCIGMSVGYYNVKGEYGYFVAPASPPEALFLAWCDCLGDNFKPFKWPLKPSSP